MWKEIGNGVTSKIKKNCITTFQKKLYYHSPLHSCDACGIRRYTTYQGSYFDLKDPLLQLLRLNSKSIENHDKLGIFKNLCSIFIFPADNLLRYYIHPELVESVFPNNFRVYVCSPCISYLRKGCLLRYSIANGFDFGRMERLPHLKPLTIIEVYLITHIRLFMTEFKLVAQGKNNVDSVGSSCLKGHIISFPNDGPQAAANRLKVPSVFPYTEDITNMIGVKFVGSNMEFVHYLLQKFSCPELRIRGKSCI